MEEAVEVEKPTVALPHSVDRKRLPSKSPENGILPALAGDFRRFLVIVAFFGTWRPLSEREPQLPAFSGMMLS